MVVSISDNEAEFSIHTDFFTQIVVRQGSGLITCLQSCLWVMTTSHARSQLIYVEQSKGKHLLTKVIPLLCPITC